MNEKERLLRIVENEIALHTNMTPVDLQKLVYQAVFGIDHLLKDQDRFAMELLQEWEGLDMQEGVEEDLLQTIDPVGRTGRVHLRGCKARGVNVEKLVQFLVAQSPANGTRERFIRLWTLTRKLAREEKVPFSEASLAALSFPETPPHHSVGYRDASYRVVNDLTDPKTVAFIQEVLVGA